MKKRVFALFTAMFLLCGMLAGCGPTGSSSVSYTHLTLPTKA